MLTANQKLDSVLRYLKQNHDEKINIQQGIQEDGTRWTSISPLELDKHWKNELEIRFHIFTNYPLKETRVIMDHLLREGLVENRRYNNDEQYTITFKGKILVENGGFEMLEKRQKFIDASNKYWWIPIVISIFSLIIATLALIFNKD